MIKKEEANFKVVNTHKNEVYGYYTSVEAATRRINKIIKEILKAEEIFSKYGVDYGGLYSLSIVSVNTQCRFDREKEEWYWDGVDYF